MSDVQVVVTVDGERVSCYSPDKPFRETVVQIKASWLRIFQLAIGKPIEVIVSVETGKTQTNGTE